MNKPPKSGLVVFGRLAQKSPRAAWLAPGEAAIADWLATHFGLVTIRVTPEILKTVEVPIDEWQLDANGKPIIPVISVTAFERLRSLASQVNGGDPIGLAAKGKPATETAPEPSPELAQAGKVLWEAIRVHSVVLAQEDDAEDGWWEAVVLAVNNGHCTLCWRDYPEQGLFRRKRNQLALARPTN